MDKLADFINKNINGEFMNIHQDNFKKDAIEVLTKFYKESGDSFVIKYLDVQINEFKKMSNKQLCYVLSLLCIASKYEEN
tara:strand:- start:123 stop:362 length:240 start_codon:yes stop_codon:yes gene_type:complete